MHATMNVEHEPYVKCPNAPLGCQATFPQTELLAHLDSCFFEKFRYGRAIHRAAMPSPPSHAAATPHRQQQNDLAVLKKAFSELLFKYTAAQGYPHRHTAPKHAR